MNEMTTFEELTNLPMLPFHFHKTPIHISITYIGNPPGGS